MKRLALPGVTPLELWDAPSRGGILQDFRHRPELGDVLAELVVDLPQRLPPGVAAEARTAATRVGHVHLLGGGAGEALRAAIAARGVPCTLAVDATFAPARAGLHLLDALARARAPLSVDVGQTSLKTCSASGSARLERDLDRAPLRSEGLDATTAREVRARTRTFVADVIASRGPCDALLLALPCEIDGHRLGPCTYAWGDDAGWLAELAPRAGCADAGLTLTSDAELAAAAWRACDASASTAGVTLVLTIGFGVGAALVEAPARGLASVAPR